MSTVLKGHLMGYRPVSVFLLSKKIFFVCFLLLFSACRWGTIGYNDGYAPEQPIKFSHAEHAGKYGIQCLYCHSSAEHGRFASVPSLETCMGCHTMIATDKPEIQKLTEMYLNNESIPWVRVHMLPDHTKFTHQPHVQKYGTPESCRACHGPVESMEVMYQYSPLSMGECIECHRSEEANAPINCSTCHF